MNRFKLTTRPEGSQYKLAFHSPLRWFVIVIVAMIMIIIFTIFMFIIIMMVMTIFFFKKTIIRVILSSIHHHDPLLSLENKLGETLVRDGMYWSSEVIITLIVSSLC